MLLVNTMDDLIMRIRLESLNKSFIKVKKPFKLIDERFDEIDDLLDVLKGGENSIYSSLETINDDVSFAHQKVLSMKKDIEKGRPVDRRKVDESDDYLKEASKYLERVFNLLSSAEEKVDLTHDRCIRIKKGDPLELMLSNKSDEMMARVSAIKNDFELSESKSNGDRVGNLFNIWKNLSRLTYKESPEIFSEYVDSLRGMALRSTGLDSEICKISDELIKKCKEAGNVGWQSSITIPDQKEALNTTFARIIRMGFPEWSIWTLPLTAHEFGHVVASEKTDKLPGNQFETMSLPKEHLEEYIADAFATYAMGPAYAYAAILMRFDPFLACFDQWEWEYPYPSCAKRAFVILRILEKMQEKASRDDPAANKETYNDVITGLRNEWRAALIQAKIPENQIDKGEIDQLRSNLECLKSHHPKFVSDNFFKAIESLRNKMEFNLRNLCLIDAKRDEDALTIEDRDILSKLVDYLWNMLDPIAVSYPSTSWQKSKDFGAKLLSEDKIVIPSSMDLKDVLNAAWYVRIADLSMTEFIENKAQEIMKEILTKVKKGETDKESPYGKGV